MYEDIDDELAATYDAKLVAKNVRTPRLPDVEATTEADLLRVSRVQTRKGKLYEFKFKAVKSNSESVCEGATYTISFFPGGEDKDKNAIFWEKVTPLLMVLRGETNLLTFDAITALGEFLSLSKGEEDLGLRFGINRRLVPCRPDKKTGKCKHVNEDGTPKIFAEDSFFAVSSN